MAYFDAVTRVGLGGPVRQYVGFAAAASVVISGSATESNIVGQVFGGILTNDTLLAAGTGPIGSIANTQELIDGLVSAQSEPNGFNALRSLIAVTDVTRVSDTEWSLTIPAGFSSYVITADEILTWTIPAAVLTGASLIIGTPTIGISDDVTVAPSGGWIVRDVFDTLVDRKRRKLKALREKLEEVKEIAGIDGEIAVLLHQDDEKELIESSLKELENLVKSASRTQIEQQFNTRVAKAFTRASVQGNFSALQAFEREMERVREEEAFFLIAAVMILQ